MEGPSKENKPKEGEEDPVQETRKEEGGGKGKEKQDSKEKKDEIKDLIKKVIKEDGEHYGVKIQHPKTGEVRNSEPIPRIREIEDLCKKERALWPLQLYCGVKSAELDKDIANTHSIGELFSCVLQVIMSMLRAFPHIKLSEVEKVLRKGDCNTFLVAKKPPIVGEVTGIIHDGEGNPCEWFYDLAYGTPANIREVYKESDCYSTRENMERLEKAGYITVNKDDLVKEGEKIKDKMARKMMDEKKKEALEKQFKQKEKLTQIE